MNDKYLITPLLFLVCITFLVSCRSDDDLYPKPVVEDEGSILWQTEALGENLEATPAVDENGNVYMLADGVMFSYTESGALRWSTEVTGGDANVASLSPDNQVVYTPGVDGIYAVDATTGAIIWKRTDIIEAEFYTVTAVSPDGSRIYLGAGGDPGHSNNFYALNAVDGSIAWVYEETESVDGLSGYMGGAIMGENGAIYVTNQQGFLISLTDNGDSFIQNWKFNLGAEARQPAALAGNGYILQTSNTGVIHKIDLATGVEITTESWPALGGVGEVFTSIVLSPDGRTFYVNAEDHNLYALDIITGAVKWFYTFEEWGSDPLIREDGVIIVMGQINGAARVCALQDNGESATLLWSSPKIFAHLTLNESNVNISPNGTIYIHAGDQHPLSLFAVKGNGLGLSSSSPWPKTMGNMQNNGNR